MYLSENQKECEGSGTQHSYSTSLARSQGLTLARCIQTRGLSRGIKIVMDSHTILTNVDAIFKYNVFVHAGIWYSTILLLD